jgi:putative spermidine/putrescine transport system substrate-binding protein
MDKQPIQDTGSSTRTLSRRQLIAAGAAFVLSSPSIVRAQTKTIVMTSSGGIYEKNFRAAVLTPFEEKHGVKFQMKYGSPGEWLTNAMVNRDDPEIDLLFLVLPIAIKASRTPGVFLELTPAMIPNVKDVDPVFYDVYNRMAVGFNYVDAGIAYRTDVISKPPLGWADLWDSRFKGQVMVSDVTGPWPYEMVVIAAILNGGSATNLEPGFEAMKRLRPNVARWFKTSNEVITALERNEAAVAMAGSFRTYSMKDAGVPVDYVIPKEGAPVGVLSFHVPTKARNRDLLLEFINFAIGKDPQSAFGNDMQSGVVNRKAVLRPEIANRTVPVDKLMRIDWQAVAPQMSNIVSRMQREVIAR